MHYAPHPTLEQLACLRDALAPAGKVEVERRIKGGLGCTLVALDEIGDEAEDWEASHFGGLPQVLLMAARKNGS